MVPPKFPVPSTRKVPDVQFRVPLPETVPPKTFMLEVEDAVPAVMVRLLVVVAASFMFQTPPEPLKVKL